MAKDQKAVTGLRFLESWLKAFEQPAFIILWSVTFFVVNSLNLSAQLPDQLFFERILSENVRIEKGLSQNTVNTMLQDADGFMWFGTWDGLNRYDGYEFLIYNRQNGLSNETIRALLQRNDTLWVGTEEGLNLLKMSTGEIHKFYHDEGDSTSLSSNMINHIFEDHLGTIWISTAEGLSAYRPLQQNFSRVISMDYGNPMRSNFINMTTQDTANNYWIATSYGLVLYEIENQRLTRYFHIPDDLNSLPDNHVNALAFDQQQRMWVGTKAGLCLYQPLSRNFKIVDEENGLKPEITTIHIDGDQGLWLGTNGSGLYYYDFDKETFSHYTHIANRAYSISDNRIYSLYSDHYQNLWVGTFNGLNKLDKRSPKFRLYRSQQEVKNSLANNSVWAFWEEKPGKIWIGTDQGLTVVDKNNNSYEFVIPRNDEEMDLSQNLVRSIFQDSEGIFWIGFRNKGLSRYDPIKKTFRHFESNPRNPRTLPDNYVTAIKEDSLGRIWIATENGLARLNQNEKDFTVFRHQPNNSRSLPADRLYDLYIDTLGRFWLATASGLAIYNYNTDSFTTIQSNDPKRELYATGGDKLFSITAHKDGSLWMGTRGEGLLRYDPATGKFNRFTEQDGLPNNVTYKALEDSEGIIWITTNWGLSRFNPNDSSFSNYDVTNGLQSNEFNLNAALIASDGEIFIGGMNGYNAFYPEDITVNSTPPPVRITAFKKFNMLQQGNLRDGDTIILNYDDNYFAFEFAALDFTNPYKNKYRFILENYNKNWIERDASQRFAEFARVNPGTYNFRLLASNSDGYWNLKGINLIIVILPAWYDTWWFRGLVVLLFIFLLYGLIVIRMNALRKKHEVEKKYLAFEKQMYQLEQKALQLQMNPHFLFNSINSIQSFVVNNDIDNAIHYLSKFSQLMRRILSNSGESFVPLRDELQALRLYLEIESLRFHGKFSFDIQMDPEIDDNFLEIPPMILQPYVENAILHGLMHSPKKGHLQISLTLNGDNVLCVIQDDGIGRERAAQIRKESGIERKSRGMLITQERLDILNQYSEDIYTVNVIDLHDKDGQAAGTRVEIRIHYKE
jgi:ligand-binding sensor domain-containing protein